jgi:hypothetical protein
VNLRIRDLATVGGLLAAAFVLKMPAFALPNVEPFTLVYFFIGYRYGIVSGALVGGTGEFLYSVLNPMGAAIPPVIAAQVLGMSVAGCAGGVVATVRSVFGRPHRAAPTGRDGASDLTGAASRAPTGTNGISDQTGAASRAPTVRRWVLAGIAAVVTLIYDLLTNLAMVWTVGNVWVWLVAGIPFSALHIASNSLLFAFAFPALNKIVPGRQGNRGIP